MAVILAVTLGPVSSFISGGRRSRDLWYGSRFLSEATRIAAESLANAGAELVFPDRKRLAHRFIDQHEGPTISNKILAQMADADPAPAVEQAEKAARTFLLREMRELAGDPRTMQIAVRDDIKAQAEAVGQGDFLQFYAAWTPATEHRKADVQRVWRLLDARKRVRTFNAPSFTRPGVAKSSLDAGRDTVLIEVDARENPAAALWLDVMRAQAYVRPEERLDAVGLARRRAMFRVAGAELPALQFPSLARVALDPWIQGAGRQEPKHLGQVRGHLQVLHDTWARRAASPLFLLTSPVRDPQRAGQGFTFGFDPEILMENAIPALRRSLADAGRRARTSVVPHGPLPATSMHADDTRTVVNAAVKTLDDVAVPVAELHRSLGVPIPYVAILAADGDGIGRQIAEAAESGSAPALVAALDAFARLAWSFIARQGGCAFYVGGDELTAYLPVDHALAASTDLVSDFAKRMADLGVTASLSVGIAVGHVKDDLRALRRRAQGALEGAKDRRRDARATCGYLCVVEEPRGGTARRFVGPVGDLVARHDEWRALLRPGESQGISLATAHHLLTLAEHFSVPDDDPRNGGGSLGLDLARASILQKARRSESPVSQSARDAVRACAHWNDVREVAAEILFAERVERIAAQRCHSNDPTEGAQ